MIHVEKLSRGIVPLKEFDIAPWKNEEQKTIFFEIQNEGVVER
jgi:hypothetical protein